MTTRHALMVPVSASGQDSGVSRIGSAAATSSRRADPGSSKRTGARVGAELRLDPAELAPNLSEILVRLRRLRTEISALTPLAHRPVGDQIVQELDDVIQRARLVVSGVANGRGSLPLPGSRGVSAARVARRLGSRPAASLWPGLPSDCVSVAITPSGAAAVPQPCKSTLRDSTARRWSMSVKAEQKRVKPPQ